MANVYMGTDVEDFIFGEATYEEACGKKEACSKEGCKKEEACSKEGCKKENTDISDISVDVETDKDGKIATQVKEGTEYDQEIIEAVEYEMATCGVMECVDDPEVACYRIALENEQNYNKILNAFMEMEIFALESTGVEMVYEASKINTFFEAVQKAIDLFWQKIQGVFKSVNQNISNIIDRNSAFVKKYGHGSAAYRSIVKPEKEFNYKGYKFNTYTNPLFGKVSVGLGKVYEELKANSSAEVDVEAKKDQFRSYLCGKDSGSVTADAFSDELKNAFYGSKEKVEVPLQSFDIILQHLGSGKSAKDSVKNMYNNCKTTVSNLKKEVKKAEKETEGDKMAAAKQFTSLINSSLSMMSKALSVKISALNAELSQYRAMGAFYVANQPKASKKSSANESALEKLGITLV